MPKDINEYLQQGADIKQLIERAKTRAGGRLSVDFDDENNFISEYIKMAEEITDAPREFHFFLAYAILGSYMRKRVWLPWGSNNIYPNFYLVTLAPSSSFRKSTALSIAHKIISKSGVKILPADFSLEALIDTLGKNPQATFIHYELKTLLAVLNRDYNSGAKPFLTEIYDCPEEYSRSTKGGGEITLTNSCVSILSCTTLEWFLSEIKDGDVEGGFLARFMYIPAFVKDKSIAIPTALAQTKIVNMLTWLKSFELEGIMSLSQEAKTVWEKWYFEQEAKNQNVNSSLSAFLVRLQTYALKFAMLNAVAFDRKLVISAASMERAIEVVEWLAEQITTIMTNDMASTKFGKDMKKVLKIVKKNKTGIARSTLLRNMELPARQLEEIIQTLVQTGEITISQKGERGAIWITATFGE